MLTKPQLKKLEREAAKLADRVHVEKLKRFAAVDLPRLQKKYLGKAFKHTMGKGDLTTITYYLVTKVAPCEGWQAVDVTWVEFYRFKGALTITETTRRSFHDDELFRCDDDHTPIELQEFLRELESNLDTLADTFGHGVFMLEKFSQ